MIVPSKSEINRCGELVRKVRYEGYPLDADDLDHAIEVISWFRAQHAYPMAKVRYGLSSMVRTEGGDEVVSQRLKRVPRIVRKLQRTVGSSTGRTALARLEDIGGVRAILRDGAELERVRRRVDKNWKSDYRRPPRDYIAEPKAIGYRAVHFIVVRDGRAIEVQLRTRGQQQWADAAEQADARLAARGVNLKDSEGPEEMLEYFSAAGEVIYRREYGLPMSFEVTRRFNNARRAVIAGGYYNA
ncbi:RelA/SpoT domain-containing protein [Mycolicibacterium sp. D5.8-2]|uniref:RelA/SpoT domain-containing protein n=1 Tax=Mycolicibacterium sp. D5.8-2 TaxID=3085903 RepID=UPI00298C72DD|nr:RelA/SpoT domain-containing protein [Mycolicibacterium sp. D5.8-2]MDW5612501.1 RelA/SpoT domain-containing protein [Mycolicibacterium sp. D5.8-2]